MIPRGLFDTLGYSALLVGAREPTLDLRTIFRPRRTGSLTGSVLSIRRGAVLSLRRFHVVMLER